VSPECFLQIEFLRLLTMETRVFSPETLAARWNCSPRHVRNLINDGALAAFRLGRKLLRISLLAVEEFEKCQMTENGKSESSTANVALYGTTPKENGDVIALGPVTRAKLQSKRRESLRS